MAKKKPTKKQLSDAKRKDNKDSRKGRRNSVQRRTDSRRRGRR